MPTSRDRLSGGLDLDAFLSRPLTARVATTTPDGPRVRPVWFLWEGGVFWLLTGPWSDLGLQVAHDDRVAIVIDVADLSTGEVVQVIANGRATVRPYDADRARRKLTRYLGDDLTRYGDRFDPDEMAPGTCFLRIDPHQVRAKDLSIDPPPGR